MSQRFKGWVSFSLVLGLMAGSLPAQASEVVKLARLVTSGKRTSSEVPRTMPQEPRPASGSQAHGSGSTDDTGPAPTPVRGVS